MQEFSRTVWCHDIYKKKKQVPVSELSFRPSVYGVILKGVSVLLLRQWDGWDFPGGGLHLGETLEQGLRREVWEETGLRVTPGPVVVCENSFFIPFGHPTDYKHAILMYFLCTKFSGRITTRHFDDFEKQNAGKAQWVPLKDVKRLKMYNSVDSVEVVERALQIRRA